MRSGNRPYLPRVDLLRGLAAYWVVAYHGVQLLPSGASEIAELQTGNPVLLAAQQGWLGVSLFLLISGFSLGGGLRGTKVSWSRYLAARWLRVAPLYLLMVALALATVGMSLSQLIASVTILPIPEASSAGPWLWVAWSVRLEFALYFTLPILVFLATQLNSKSLLASLPIMTLLVTFMYLQSGVSVVDTLYYGLPGRFIEFATGFVLGFYSKGLSNFKLARSAGLLSMVLFVGLVLALNMNGTFPSFTNATRLVAFATMVLASSCALIWATSQTRNPDQTGMAVAARIGAWSYSTYMWHMPVLIFLALPLYNYLIEAGLSESLALLLGVSALLFLMLPLSWASFWSIEMPFLKLRPKYVQPVAN